MQIYIILIVGMMYLKITYQYIKKILMKAVVTGRGEGGKAGTVEMEARQ